MDKEEYNNWVRIKEHFETLSEEMRETQYYKRAVAIVDGKDDPLDKLK